MSATDGTLVAIGVGNVLLGDDGVGVRVIEQLRAPTTDGGALPPGTRLVDGGTLGLELLRELDGVGGLVLVDAGDRGDPPGTVTVHRGAGDAGLATAGDAGSDGVGELIAVAGLLGVLPRAVAIVEIAVDEVSVGTGLSPAVETAVPRAVEAARRELIAMAGPAGETGPEPHALALGASA